MFIPFTDGAKDLLWAMKCVYAHGVLSIVFFESDWSKFEDIREPIGLTSFFYIVRIFFLLMNKFNDFSFKL